MEVAYNGKPLERIPYAEKIANKHKFFTEIADYYIESARFDEMGSRTK